MGDHEQAHTNIRTKKPAVSGGGLGTKDETKILKHWGYLKKTLHLAHIVDPLIEKGVLTIDRWMALKSKSISEAERVEEFLYALLKGKPETYSIFLVALKSRGYTQMANQLEGIGSEEISPPLSGEYFRSVFDAAPYKQWWIQRGFSGLARTPSPPSVFKYPMKMK